MTWDTKKVIAVAVLVGALTQIGNGLKAMSWLVGVPDAAYSGQETAQKVDEEFKQYLAAQKASTEAIKGYIASQQASHTQPALPAEGVRATSEHPDATAGHASAASPPVEEVSDDGEVKVLVVEGIKLCCDGTTCWAWNQQTQCAR